jgi:pSer/pThr/pTyr-binding forkhead associated (FHA) protein
MPSPQPINSPGPSEIQANFGQTTFLDDEESDRTIILGAEMANDVNSRPMLVRKKNNEQIILRKDLFTIGKEAKYVDYVIRDNRTISRSHASFITRDGNYYVIDTNSTNHVYVDGKMIPCNQEIPITNGMNIRLSNEEFEFRLY